MWTNAARLTGIAIAIREDGTDPQLLANLTRLGPVKVDHGMHGFKLTGMNASRMLNAQKQSETEAQAGGTKRNHLQAPSLFDALTRLQEAKDHRMVDKLAGEYNLDSGVLRELGKTVNVPTPDETTARTVVDEDGSEVVLKTVRSWFALQGGQFAASPTHALFSRRSGLFTRPSNSDILPEVTRKNAGAFRLDARLTHKKPGGIHTLLGSQLPGGPTIPGRLIMRTRYGLHLFCSFDFVLRMDSGWSNRTTDRRNDLRDGFG